MIDLVLEKLMTDFIILIATRVSNLGICLVRSQYDCMAAICSAFYEIGAARNQ
jgi:hypothetical protein